MKRTINEIYDLIKQKHNNAYSDYVKVHEQNNKTKIFNHNINDFVNYQMNVILEYKLKAYCECYLDIISLIETSHILHDNKDFTLQQKAYDNVISIINNVLEDADITKQFLIDHIDELVEVIRC